MTNFYDVANGLSQDEPGPLEPVEIAQQDDTLARTGNTARDQEMYVAGIRTGEENAKHNAAIRADAAPGVSTVEEKPAAWMEPGIDVPVTNEYRNKTPLRQAKYCVPLYKHAPVHAPAAGDALDAARWRFVRRKLCLTGNGDGTCAMQAINLPASIPGWPEPGSAVAEFCDAAIDAAIAAQRKGDA